MLRGPARLLGAALSNSRSHAARSIAGPSPRRLSDRSGVRRQAAIVNGQATHANESLSPAALLSSSQQSMQRLVDEHSGVTVTVYPTTVSLRCPRLGLCDEYHFDHVWLRDVCMEGNSVEKDTRQKLFHTSDINIPSADSSAGLLNDHTSATLTASGSGVLPTLQLTYHPMHAVTNAFSAAFSSAPPPSPVPHVSNIPVSLLLEHALPDLYSQSHGDIGGTSHAWEAADLSGFPASATPLPASQVEPGLALDKSFAFARPSRVAWGAMLGEQEGALDARFALVDGLMRDGIAFVTGLPTDKTGDSIDASDVDSPSLARLAEMLGSIRHTFYGSLWNVRSLGSSSRNIAYTNLDLGLHMDLCYFQNPPRFQFLHMLRNKVQGGDSIFVDSYRVAEEMWTNHRALWQALVDVPVGFHYQNDNHHYRYTHPTFELTSRTSGHAAAEEAHAGGQDGIKMPRLTAVNYSPPFQSPLPLHPAVSVEQRSRFYEALQLFSRLSLQDRFRYERTLVEGECVIFDNRRVLHSRRGFQWSTDEESSGEGVKRWLKGCYIDGDAIWSTYRTLLARSRGGKLGL